MGRTNVRIAELRIANYGLIRNPKSGIRNSSI